MIVLTFLLLILCDWTNAGVNGTVYEKNGELIFKRGVLDHRGIAFALFNDTLNATGWSTLDLYAGSKGNVSDGTLMFAAGYLEGVLSAPSIAAHSSNMRAFWFGSRASNETAAIEQWLRDQDKWARAFARNDSADATARVLGLAFRQFDGLLAGVQSVFGPKAVSRTDLLVLQAGGDLIDVVHRLDVLEFHRPATYRNLFSLLASDRCSALVKVTPGLENVFMSHATWFSYSSTYRVFKHYYLNLKDSAVKAKKMSFSGYPGILVSIDDFYILGSKMVVLQTTNNIFDDSLYKMVSTSSLLAWQRVLTASRAAHDAAEWLSHFRRHNSGTYNNQYMVVDLKRIHLKQSIDDGALTIVEQIPGLVQASDQTPILRNGHWPSYNVPFHERIYNMSGYPDFVRKHGVAFSYQLAPRAELFRRDAGRVTSLADMQRLMRSNDYKHDPYSAGNPTSAICSRGDLLTKSPTADGCYDGKVTDVAMALRFESEAVSGPTTAAGTLPPFSWDADTFRALPHEGLPSSYAFNWTEMRPRLW